MNVEYLINKAVREFPENVAIVDGNIRFTFRELNNRVNRIANAILKMGVKKGDRLGILLENCHQFIEIDLALSKTGIVRVPLNSRLSAPDHIYLLNDSEPNVLIFGEKFYDVVQHMRKELETVKRYICISEERLKENPLNALYYEELVEQNSPEEPDVEITEEDLHTLFYTSGTTGKPKGVMLTQKSWANVATNILLSYGPITQNDIILNVQPLSHGAGFLVLPFFVKGATNVLVEFTPRLVFETIQKERVTVLKLVPIMLYRLMDAPEKEEYDLSSLTHIIYGGSPISHPRLVEALRFFGQKLAQLYGQAEIPMCISTLSREDHVLEGSEEELERLDSAGKPCINVQVKVVDGKGEELESGEIGEIIAKGYHSMKGYWKLPEATAETLKDGWVYTGDLGYMDSKGFIFLVDRKKDLIISGAFNIYPAEVENVIITHPSVKEVAVIGVPDDTWGEAVKAIVVLKKGSGVTDQGIMKLCKDKGLGFKSPKSIDFVKEIPRNPYGKIDKKTLRELYWKGYGRAIH